MVAWTVGAWAAGPVEPPLTDVPEAVRVGLVGGAAAAGGAIGAGLGYSLGTLRGAGFCDYSDAACEGQGFVFAGLGATIGAVGGGGSVAWAVGARPSRTVWGAGGSALAGTALGVGLGVVTRDVPLSIAAGVGAVALGTAITVATDRPVAVVPEIDRRGAGLRVTGRF